MPHLLRHPRIICLDWQIILRRYPLSLRRLSCLLPLVLMNPAPLSCYLCFVCGNNLFISAIVPCLSHKRKGFLFFPVFSWFPLIFMLFLKNLSENLIWMTDNMLGMEAFQLLPVPESPGNAYRLKTGAQSCFHICVGITEIQALLRLYSKPVQNQLYTCRIRLSGNSRLFSCT